jgi:tetratricopeptide (TPR) repeat protein
VTERVWRFEVLFSKSTIAGVLLAVLAAGCVTISLPAQDRKKEWKDRTEYELYESITKTQDPNQWLSTLEKWKQAYPQSDFVDVRRKLYLESYRALNRPRDAFSAAQEVMKDNPNDLVAVSSMVGYIYPLVPLGVTLDAQSTADVEAAEKAAVLILSNLEAIYSKDNRPATMTDEQVNQARPALKVFAQKTLGYIALERKDYPKAQAELTKALEMDPNQGQVSYWLGSAVLAQNKTNPELQPVALYDFARAAAYDGAGSLPVIDRKQVLDYLSKVYVQYHGSTEGLDKLLAQAKSSALPPRDITIQSKSDIERAKIEADEAAAKANPSLALWRDIKRQLVGSEGTTYFENSMKDALLPRFKGKLVSMTPAIRPKELVLAVDGDQPDVTLKVDGPLAGKMDPGGEISFEGVAVAFQKEPFMVTLNVEKSHIEGWMGKTAPAATKKHTAQKKSGAN